MIGIRWSDADAGETGRTADVVIYCDLPGCGAERVRANVNIHATTDRLLDYEVKEIARELADWEPSGSEIVAADDDTEHAIAMRPLFGRWHLGTTMVQCCQHVN